MQFLRPISISLAVAMLTAITVYIVSYLIYPVSGINVEGARMLPKSEVWQAVPDRASLVTLNVTLLEKRIESNLWVESANASRDWSSGIVTVKVEERRAFVRGELDGRKVVYAADGTQIPSLGGIGLKSMPLDRRRLEEILKAGKILEDNGVAVDSIVGAGASGIEATIEGRKVLFTGDVGAGQAQALPKLMSRHPEVRSFDLRSPERIVVEDRSVGESSG